MSEFLVHLTPLTAVILVLACASITRFITVDKVPFGWLRDRIMKNHPAEGSIVEEAPINSKVEFVRAGSSIYHITKGSFWGDLLTCPYCVGTYVAFVVWGAFWLWPTVITVLCAPLALRWITGRLLAH